MLCKRVDLKFVQEGDYMNAYIEMYAVVLGVDESILNIRLQKGFIMKKMKLDKFLFKDRILRADGHLNQIYYASNLNNNETDAEYIFLCRKKELDLAQDYYDPIELVTEGCKKVKEKIFDPIVSEWNQEIFYILSLFRMAGDGNVEIADRFYHLATRPGINKINLESTTSIDEPLGVYDDFYRVNKEDLERCQFLQDVNDKVKVLMEDIFERFSRGYTSSKYDSAYKELITLTEIILIGKDSSDGKFKKKQVWANRMTVSLAEENEAADVFIEMKNIYKNRSNETHEGKNENITKESLCMLRCYTRKILLQFLEKMCRELAEGGQLDFHTIKVDFINERISMVRNWMDHGSLPRIDD